MGLEQDIKNKRQTLIALGMVKGFTHKEVVKCSQELDELINLYQKNDQSTFFIYENQKEKYTYIPCN